VPQAYLRAFAADEKRQKIWRLSKEEGDAELKPIEKVAVRFHLYAPKGADGRRNDALERKLSKLEQFIGDRVWQALCNDFVDLEWEPLRKMLALILATNFVRTPTRFEHWKAQHRAWIEQFSQFPALPTHLTIGGVRRELDHSDWDQFRTASEEDMKRAWNAYVGSPGDLARTFLGMRWAIVFAEEPVFVTSDNPVTVDHPSLTFKGLKDPETTVSFPLSPTRMLQLDNRHAEMGNAYWPLKHSPAWTNLLTWRNSIEYMFSHRDPHEVCAEMDRCNLKNLPPPRVDGLVVDSVARMAEAPRQAA
jgi:hypothetical protein